jgi:hypothetical protein
MSMGSGLNWSGGWDQIHNPESYSLEFEGIRLQATQAARSAWRVELAPALEPAMHYDSASKLDALLTLRALRLRLRVDLSVFLKLTEPRKEFFPADLTV